MSSEYISALHESSFLSPLSSALFPVTISLSDGIRGKGTKPQLWSCRRARRMYFYVSAGERDARALPSLGISISASERTRSWCRARLRILPKDRPRVGSGQPLPPCVAPLIERAEASSPRKFKAPRKLNIHCNEKRYGKCGLRIHEYVNSNNVKTFFSS